MESGFNLSPTDGIYDFQTFLHFILKHYFPLGLQWFWETIHWLTFAQNLAQKYRICSEIPKLKVAEQRPRWGERSLDKALVHPIIPLSPPPLVKESVLMVNVKGHVASRSASHLPSSPHRHLHFNTGLRTLLNDILIWRKRAWNRRSVLHTDTVSGC